MPKDPAYITDFKTEMRTSAASDVSHVKDIENELYNSTLSDRARVILAASYVDDHLERLLASRMREDLNSSERKQVFEYDGVAGTFSAKISLAYALALIGKETKFDLELIKLIRNLFAHSKSRASFKVNSIHAVCAEFKLIKRQDTYLRLQYQVNLQLNDKPIKSRTAFLATCDALAERTRFKISGPQEGDVAYINDESLP